MHAHVGEDVDQQAALWRIQRFLSERFGIAHATIQIECGKCSDDVRK